MKFLSTVAVVVATTLFINANAEADERRVRAALAAELPGIDIETITESALPGIFEVTFAGGILYASDDGRFVLLNARLLDLRSQVDLTERTRSSRRVQTLANVPESEMIIFEPDTPVAHTITTFTDVDCPYCRKMHAEIGDLTAAGIRVRYLMFPRTAVGSPSYDKAVSVWCAADQQQAMTQAKAGQTPDKKTCDNPVQNHMALARHLGLTGTPFTITESGRVITGYMPAARLLKALQSYKAQAAR